MAGSLEGRIERLAADREHGASRLARAAIEIIADARPQRRPELADQLARLRPAMPSIGAAAFEAAGLSDPRALLLDIAAEHGRVAATAAALLAGEGVIATISHSSLVERALLLARPTRVEVVVTAPNDEGHRLAASLREAGVEAVPVAIGEISARAGLTGSDAIFDDGAFVNRRGTAALVARLAPGSVVVVGDRWRRVGGSAPPSWPEPELFELVPAAANLTRVL